MSTSQLAQINKFCQRQDTKTRATELLHQIIAKTCPGSGHVLDAKYTVGLPAVCAYIASEKLNNGDINKDVAHSVSCLTKPSFLKCYERVKDLLDSTQTVPSTPSRRTSRASADTFYDRLYANNDQTVPLEDMRVWLSEAEHMLTLVDEKHLDMGDTSVKYGVFYWVHCIVLGPSAPTVEDFAISNSFRQRDIRETLSRCHTHGGKLQGRIKDQLERLRMGLPARPVLSATPSPRKSPTKRTLREPPTKDSPTKLKRKPEPELAVMGDAMDVDVAPSSPRKKFRLELPVPFVDPSTPSKSRTAARTNWRRESSPSPMRTSRSPSPTPAAADSKIITTPRKPSRNAAAGPSTPSRAPRMPPPASPTKLRQTATSVELPASPTRKSAPMTKAKEVAPDPVKVPRYRPVYAARKQWLEVNPEIQDRLKDGEKLRAELARKYGHPFAKYRVAEVAV